MSAAQPTVEPLDLAALETRIDAHRGHVLVVHHFATWCSGCVEEMPLVTAVHAAQAALSDVAWLGVSWERFLSDAPDEDLVQALSAFAVEHDLRFPIVMYTGAPEPLMQALGITRGTIPHTAVYGRGGQTLLRIDEPMIDARDADRLRHAVEAARARS